MDVEDYNKDESDIESDAESDKIEVVPESE